MVLAICYWTTNVDDGVDNMDVKKDCRVDDEP